MHALLKGCWRCAGSRIWSRSASKHVMPSLQLSSAQLQPMHEWTCCPRPYRRLSRVPRCWSRGRKPSPPARCLFIPHRPVFLPPTILSAGSVAGQYGQDFAVREGCSFHYSSKPNYLVPLSPHPRGLLESTRGKGKQDIGVKLPLSRLAHSAILLAI